MLGESALDGLGHFKLAGAVFVGQRGARKDAAGREELVEGGQGRVEVSVEAIGGGAFPIIGPSQTTGDRVGFRCAPHFDNIHELRPAFRIER